MRLRTQALKVADDVFDRTAHVLVCVVAYVRIRHSSRTNFKMASTNVAGPVDREGWSKFVDKVAQLEPKEQRAIASIFGAVVADAAGKILHVLYVLQLATSFLVIFSSTCYLVSCYLLFNLLPRFLLSSPGQVKLFTGSTICRR